MALKTIIKKACKQHFDDIYESINELDNENYDLENPLDVDIKHKQAIEKIEEIDDLTEYWRENQGSGKGFDKLIQTRKEQLTK
jgi:recombinational DNA repair protein RecT